jgi:hypothetical protein
MFSDQNLGKCGLINGQETGLPAAEVPLFNLILVHLLG